MSLRYLLVDLDDTLLDYRLAERMSLLETLSQLGITPDADVCTRYSLINRELWDRKARGEITRAQLRHDRFARLLPTVGVPAAMADAANAIYSGQLRIHGDTLPGAEALLQAMHGRVKIAAVTNGVSVVQRTRLAHTQLMQWLDAVIISEETGVQKPDPAMIQCALDALGCTDRADAIMLGDSLTTDVAAAVATGIRSIWFAPDGSVSPEATWCVRSLDEARALLETLI